MSIEHSNAMPEIRPDVMAAMFDVMAAMFKHASVAAAFKSFIDENRLQEANGYNQRYMQALDELDALGVLDENGCFDLNPAEYSAITAFYAAELKRWRALAPEAAA